MSFLIELHKYVNICFIISKFFFGVASPGKKVAGSIGDDKKIFKIYLLGFTFLFLIEEDD